MSGLTVGARVEIVGPSWTGYEHRRGEVVTVSREASDGMFVVSPYSNQGGNIFPASSLRAVATPRFKTGDAVRVKAGSPLIGPRVELPAPRPDPLEVGVKLIVKGVAKREELSQDYPTPVYSLQDPGTRIEERFLEPWNDAEEWGGSRWVAKKPAYAKGDRVRITGPSQMGADYRGKLGTVISDGVRPASHGAREPFVNVQVDDTGPFGHRTFYLDAIEPVPPAPATTSPAEPVRTDYVVMLRDTQGPAPSKRPVVHDTHGSADAEARRLAEKHRGQSFEVWQLVETHLAAPVPPKHEYRVGQQVRVIRTASGGIRHNLRVPSVANVVKVAGLYELSGICDMDGKSFILDQWVDAASIEPLEVV